MKNNNQAESAIPKLELENFVFSPPGPMGWSFAEYEKLIDNPDQIVKNESFVINELAELKNKPLVEFSLTGGPIGQQEKAKEQELNTVIEENEEISLNQKFENTDKNVVEEQIPDDVEIDQEVIAEDVEVEQENEKDKNKIKIIISDLTIRKPWISPTLNRKRA